MPQNAGSAIVYTLYGSPGAASLVVHWLLLELGAEHEYVAVDTAAQQQKQPWYLALNPNGVVPTLIVDGAPRYETAALLLLLAERHPDNNLAPARGSSEAGLYYQWMLHMANTLMPAFRAWFYPHEPAGADNAEAVKAEAQRRIEATWDRLANHLGEQRPCIAGEQRTAVDFLATMLMRWSRNMPKTVLAWPALARHAERMRALPSFRELYRRERLTEWV